MLTVTEAQLMAWLSPVLWPFLRILAVFTSAPVLSSRAFPLRAKIGLALLVALSAQATLQDQPVISMDGPDALGAVKIPRTEYLKRLAKAVEAKCEFGGKA